jgi:hypothetical protein
MVFDRPNVDLKGMVYLAKCGCQGTSSKIFTVELSRELTNLSVELAYYLGGTWAQEGYPFGASQGDGF